MIAHCGLDCDACPTRIATKTNDDVLREQIAKKWSEQYNANIVADDISCDGCMTVTGKQFRHCAVCEIRTCSLDKGNSTCADCLEYPCRRLDLIFNNEPDAKARLDSLV